MAVLYFGAGEIDLPTVSAFLVESARAYPKELEHSNSAAWPSKLAKYADVFCLQRKDGTLAAALFSYLNDFENRIGYITYICSLPECEKGTAYQLHEAYCRKAVEKGMEKLRLEVLKSNSHAINFYKRQGYCIAEDRADRCRWLMELML